MAAILFPLAGPRVMGGRAVGRRRAREGCTIVSFDARSPRKLVDTSRLDDLGWRPSIALGEGIPAVYRWFLDNHTTEADRAQAHSAAA